MTWDYHKPPPPLVKLHGGTLQQLEMDTDELRNLLAGALDTGLLRTDETRDLYLRICAALRREPLTYGNG